MNVVTMEVISTMRFFKGDHYQDLVNPILESPLGVTLIAAAALLIVDHLRPLGLMSEPLPDFGVLAFEILPPGFTGRYADLNYYIIAA